MNSLYSLTNEAKKLYELATDPDTDPEVFQDTLEGLMGEIEIKASGYAYVLRMLDMETKEAEEVSKMFADKAKVRKNNIKRMKETLMYAMTKLNKTELAAGDFTFKIQKNGGIQPLKIDGEVPDNMTKVIIEPDNDKIREFLKDIPGQKCEWAHLEGRGQHIVIK